MAEMDPSELVLTASNLARLDERLSHMPEPVRAGWTSRMIIAEAAAGARLNGALISASDLMMADVDGLDILRSHEMSLALDELTLLRIASFRSPRHLFTPIRLMSLSRARVMVGGEKRTVELLWPDRFSPSGVGSIRAAFSKENTQKWRLTDPISGAAALMSEWQKTGCSEHFGMSAGRILAAAWLARCGLTEKILPILGIGFRGRQADYNPEDSGRWRSSLLKAIAEAVRYGDTVLTQLLKASDALTILSMPSRSTSRMPEVARLVLSTPAVTALSASRATGISQRSVSDMLERMSSPPASKGIISPVRELTGRDSFRVYGIDILSRSL